MTAQVLQRYVLGPLTGYLSRATPEAVPAGFPQGAAPGISPDAPAGAPQLRAATASRGMSDLGGIFSSTRNAVGGEVWTSVGEVAQKDFASMVNSGMMKGDEVHIFSGAHGFPDGTLKPDLEMFEFDAKAFGSYPGVHVHNIAEMASAEVAGILDGPGTIIGGFCNSSACLNTVK